MIDLMYGLLIGLGSTYALWIFYIAVMGLKRVKDAKQLSKTALVLGYPVLIVGYTLDFFVNITVMSLLLLEWPKETTVTSRLKRHNNSVRTLDFTGLSIINYITSKYDNFMMPYRSVVVTWTKPLLDPFDPSGKHI